MTNYEILKFKNLIIVKQNKSFKELKFYLIDIITSKSMIEWLKINTNNNLYNNGIITKKIKLSLKFRN